MHLGDGAITPECAFLTIGAAAAGLATAALSARRETLSSGRLATAGVLGAAVYAAQMVNVPILPFSSAHLVGGVLLAWCLGPALGTLTMAVVLAVQAVCLGDGGLGAWGANVVNMSLLPAGLVFLVRRFSAADGMPPRAFPTRQAAVVGGLSAASVLLAAALIVAEVGLFRGGQELSQMGPFAARMLALHAWIGLTEGLATCAAVYALGALSSPAALRLDGRRLIGTAAVAFVLVLALLPWGSRLPDGYESAAEASGLGSLLAASGVLSTWQASLQSALEAVIPNEQLLALGTMCLAGLLASCATFLCRGRLAPGIYVRPGRAERDV